MQNTLFSLLVGLFVFLFTACSDSNPTVYTESSSSEALVSSSAIIRISSSSKSSSSSYEINSSASFSSSSTTPISYGELIDERDGQIYKTIKIGEQTWMAENLNYAYLQPTSTKDSSSECFNNEPDTCAKYGRLYLWSAAMDSAGIFSLDGKGCGLGSGSCKAQPSKGVRGVCPENWHIPNESDMNNYINYANSSLEALNSVRYYWFDRFIQLDYAKPNINLKYAFLWSSVDLYGNQFDENSIKGIDFTNIDNLVKITKTLRGNTHAIRCVKDDKKIHIEHGELTDERDGQVYKTVKIGNQWWMAENLNYAYLPPNDSTTATSMCYNDVPDSCTKYGRLYMWEAAMNCSSLKYSFCNEDVYESEQYSKPYRGVCPENWHIPSHEEWVLLQSTVNNFATDLKSTVGWLNDGNGSNVLGFEALPAGESQLFLDWKGFGAGEKTCFWTTKQIDLTIHDIALGSWDDYMWASIFCLTAKSKEISEQIIQKDELSLSIRCVKDSSTAE